MRKRLVFILLLFTTFISYGQFSDTATLNQYLRDTIKDRRPDKITAGQLLKGMLGITGLLKNTTASNGLTASSGNITLGGSLTQNTSISGGSNFSVSLSSGGASSLLQMQPAGASVYMNGASGTYTSTQNIQHSGIVTSSRNGTSPNDAEIRQVIFSTSYDIYAKLSTEPNVTLKFRINPGKQAVTLGDYINTTSKDSLLTTDNSGKLVLVHKNSVASPTIFNNNGILTSNRTLTGKNNTYSLLFDSLGSFTARANTITLTSNVNNTGTPDGNTQIHTAAGEIDLKSTNRITLQGKVGIGEISPVSQLDIKGASQYTSLTGTATTRHTLNATNAEAVMGFVDIDPAFPVPARSFVIQGRDKDGDDNIIAAPLVLNPYKDEVLGYNYVGVGTTTPPTPFCVFDGTNGVGMLFAPSTAMHATMLSSVDYTVGMNTTVPLSIAAKGVNIYYGGGESESTLNIHGSLALNVYKSIPGDVSPFPLDNSVHVIIITTSGQNINMPVASTVPGRTYKIVNYSSGNITTNTSFIIGSGGATANVISNNTAIELIAVGGSWYLISN